MTPWVLLLLALPRPIRWSKNTNLPPGIAERVSFQTAGNKLAQQEREIEMLWKEFRKCYPSERAAIDAVNKNSAVILPQVNSPTKIKGTYQLLVKRMGKEVASDVITKNPGVLCCSPNSLQSQSDADIINAARFIATLDEYKGPLKTVAGLIWGSIVLSIVYRILTVKYGPDFITSLDSVASQL